jgi:hypothetical protein
MLQLLYASIARQPVASVLISIVRSAERNNRLKGISGMLIHGHQAYLQLLEGTPRSVLHLYSTIEEDRRHRICAMWRHRVERRALSANFSMGCQNADFPCRYLLDLSTFSGPRAIDFALDHAQSKYPLSSGLGALGPPRSDWGGLDDPSPGDVRLFRSN